MPEREDLDYWRYMGLDVPEDAASQDPGCITKVPEGKRHRKPVLIAFTGAAGSGKSTALQAASEFLKADRLTPVSFAAPLKAMLRAFYAELGLTNEDIRRRIDGDLKEAPCPHLGGKTPRYAMQTLGTEWGREMLDENLWVRAFATKAGSALADGYSVLTDDCRFANEVVAVEALGGVVVRVAAIENRRDPGEHKSEGGLTTIAHTTLFNFGGLTALKVQVKNLLVGLEVTA